MWLPDGDGRDARRKGMVAADDVVVVTGVR